MQSDAAKCSARAGMKAKGFDNLYNTVFRLPCVFNKVFSGASKGVEE